MAWSTRAVAWQKLRPVNQHVAWNDITLSMKWNPLMTESVIGNQHRTCNINSQGKMFRLVAGLLLLLVAATMILLVVTNLLTGSAGWWLAGVTFVSGCFLVYEGWSGWCVLRAMGIPTPI